MVYEKLIPAPMAFARATIFGILAAAAVIFVVRRWGVEHVRTITLIPLGCMLFYLLGMHGHLLDLNYSARPLAREIAQAVPDSSIVAVPDYGGATDRRHTPAYIPYAVRRDIVYGLSFYRNQLIVSYGADGIPDGAHTLVIPTAEAAALPTLLQGRLYQQLFLYEPQGLSVYRVYPKS